MTLPETTIPLPLFDASEPWIAVDSDGCVIDTMELKHRRCFTPALLDRWGLQEIAPLAREGFLHINLYSEHRGVNRYCALHLFWRWLEARVPASFFQRTVPPLDRFTAWVHKSEALSEATLSTECARFPTNTALDRTLRWSRQVNQLIKLLPPGRAFLGAPQSLTEASAAGPLYVVSSGNCAAIREEWSAAGLHAKVAEFHTQESGDKETSLRAIAARHPPGTGLMIGDSPGDADAAQAAGVLFFPITPSREEESWRIFRQQILPSFRMGRYSAADSRARTTAFRAALAQPAAQPEPLS